MTNAKPHAAILVAAQLDTAQLAKPSQLHTVDIPPARPRIPDR